MMMMIAEICLALAVTEIELMMVAVEESLVATESPET